jgi:predicted nuclease of predicted toxin-antitoxin system
VKFLIDAQLPRRMSCWFSDAGFDAMHTLDLPAGNRSTDEQIRRFARNDQRVLISKDADFVDSHLLTGHLFQTHSFLELTCEGLVLRG